MPVETLAASSGHNQTQYTQQTVIANQVSFKNNMDKLVKERPTERIDSSMDDNLKRDKPTDTSIETTTKTDIDENNVVVFTRYDSKGKEITRVPPNYKSKV